MTNGVYEVLFELLLCCMSESDFSRRYVPSRELVPTGKVDEVDIETDITSLREGQLISFTQHCPYSFCHDSQVHLGELRDGDQSHILCP
jgi:hypothetical protein